MYKYGMIIIILIFLFFDVNNISSLAYSDLTAKVDHSKIYLFLILFIFNLFYFILFYFILFYFIFILFYFILFYFILFYVNRIYVFIFIFLSFL